MPTRSRCRITCNRPLRQLAVILSAAVALATPAPTAAADALNIVTGGRSQAVVAVSPEAGKWEAAGAADLVHYVEMMSGAKLDLADTAPAIEQALAGNAPVLIVGKLALEQDASFAAAIRQAAKPDPVLRADAIGIRRRGNRVLLAGLNDDGHYHTIAELLRRWGCRWYLPTEIGECIPTGQDLRIELKDYFYGSPLEVRRYWISWLGDNAGRPEFMRRNMMNEVHVPNGHILAKYTKDLAPEGKTHWNVPITDDKTADHVARQVLPIYKSGKHVQLGMEDGLYASDSPLDRELIGLQYDKYFMTQSVTDAFLVFYNKVADRLMKAAPQSEAKIGFLAYANMTMPPVRDITAREPLVAYLAPIDIDPIHSMDDPRSGPRRELKQMLYRWAEVMQGRVVIYDYDQGMLVWRDIPNPSHQAFQRDVQHYRKAGILGVDTESRNAIATTFLNLHIRGRLLWNPDVDVDALLAEFYEKFYGPAAEPMAAYWNAIYQAWENTIVTEHEFFVAPAIYTPELVAKLGQHLAAAEAAIAGLPQQSQRSRQEQKYVERMRVARLCYEVLSAYMQMVQSGAAEADYAAAVAAGERGLAAREKLTEINGIFTTYKRYGERGPAWWPGHVQYFRELAELTDGTRGTLIAKTPLEWAFLRDPQGVGLKENWQNRKVDLTWWNEQQDPRSVASRQQNPGHWEPMRTDLYLQAQGLVTKDFQSYTGDGWYRVDLELSAEQAAGAHLLFPGVFNRCRLFVNGQQVAQREKYRDIWWYNDYRFRWDVDLSGKLTPGSNAVVLHIHNPHHMGGIFRRPILYRPRAE